MRFKLVPAAPEEFAFVERARRAVPLVPRPEHDCCARLVDRLDLSGRDVARTWLTALRALELAAETPSGFRRTEVEPTVPGCRAALLDRVFAAAAVRDALDAADGALSVDGAFEAVRDAVPAWERRKNPSRWEGVWCDRVGDLLGWLVLLEAAERVGDAPPRYVAR